MLEIFFVGLSNKRKSGVAERLVGDVRSWAQHYTKRFGCSVFYTKPEDIFMFAGLETVVVDKGYFHCARIITEKTCGWETCLMDNPWIENAGWLRFEEVQYDV